MDAMQQALRPVLQHPVMAASVILVALIWPLLPESALIPLLVVGLVLWQSCRGTKGAARTTTEPAPRSASAISLSKPRKEAVVPAPDVHISDDEFPRAGQC